MPSERFEPTIPANECPQTHAWDGAATGSAVVSYSVIKYFLILRKFKLHLFRTEFQLKYLKITGKKSQ